MNCPICDESMEHHEQEADVGIKGGYTCTACGHVICDDELSEYDPQL